MFYPLTGKYEKQPLPFGDKEKVDQTTVDISKDKKGAKRPKVNLVPPKCYQINVMKPVLPFYVDTKDMVLSNKGLEAGLHHSNTLLGTKPTQGGSKLIDMYSNPQDMDFRKAKNFQDPAEDYNPSKSMASSMTQILFTLDNASEIFGEAKNQVLSFSSPKLPQDKLFRLWLSDEIKVAENGAFTDGTGNPEANLGEMIASFVTKAKDADRKDLEFTFSMLLCQLICVDLGIHQEDKQKSLDSLFAMDKDKLIQEVNKLGYKSYFARQLFRQQYQDVPSQYLRDKDGDKVAQDLYDDYSASLKKALDSKAKTADLADLVGQTISNQQYGYKYARYDLAPNMSVGILDVDIETRGTKGMKDYYFLFPEGHRIELINQTFLYSVAFPSMDPTCQRLDKFCYPNELELLQDHKAHLELTDYRFLRLTIDKKTSAIHWLEGEEKLPDSCYSESEKVWFIAYEQSKFEVEDVDGNLEKGQSLSDYVAGQVKTFLKVPISNRSGQKVNCIHPDLTIDLLFFKDRKVTVGSFLKKLNETLTGKKMIGVGDKLTLNQISFQSLIQKGHSFRVTVKDEKRLLIDVLREVGYSEEQDEGRLIPYICNYLPNSTPLGRIPANKAIFVRKRQEGPAYSLKASFTNFFDYYLRKVLEGTKKQVLDRVYLSGHSIEFFLPKMIYVDVGKLAAGIINSLKDISSVKFSFFEDFIKKDDEKGFRSLKVRYKCIGAVVKSRSSQYEEYYPLLINSTDSGDTFVPCYDSKEEVPLSKLDLDSVKYLAMVRDETEE